MPGYSVVEVKGKLHAFPMEDKIHYQYENMMQLLDKLDHEMRAIGYVPKIESVLHSLDEEVKKKSYVITVEACYCLWSLKHGARTQIIDHK